MPSLTSAQARRCQVHLLRLDNPFGTIGNALDYLGYVQIDPINVCGRMHDLILRNRVDNYARNGLMDTLHGNPRIGFEHYLPGSGVHAAFPLDAWPYLVRGMQARRTSGRGYARQLTPEEEAVARYILNELRDRGPLGADEIEHEGHATTAWGTRGKLAKVVLEKLFKHGRVLIARRPDYRRVYDLPERVLPPDILARPPASDKAADRWRVITKLKQRRLTTLTKTEHSLVEDVIARVTVEDGPPLHCLRTDLPRLQAALDEPSVNGLTLLLAPLDPLIYDRRQVSRLWNFHYRWEVYTPAGKRTRGYYALPLLSGDALVGHVDLKADRRAGKLDVVAKQVARGHRYAPAVKELARFLGLS